ncbi:MAG: heterocyst-inhibiting protein PatX [Microcoleus sp.]
MMRVYFSILLSSLLLSATSVKAQNLEIKLTSLSQDRYASAFSKSTPENQTFYADSDRDKLPERGGGR